jgi:polyhydroxybutyrate depolymerase
MLMGRLTRVAATACVTLTLGVALTACSTAPAAATVAAADTAPGAGTTPAGACTVSRDGTSTVRTMDVDGRSRTFIEHTPAGLGDGRKFPAIIAFPGRGESDAELERYSQLDGSDAIVLYLQALDGTGGQPSWEATPYQTAAAHDYAFATDVVSWLADAPCVNPAQIDMTGKSDGAGFAASAACVISGVAAVATVSAAFYENYTRCGPSGRLISILNMHGTSDPVIPYNGSVAQGLFGTGGWIRLWVQHDQCPGPAENTSPAAQVTQVSWSSCHDGTAVVNDTIIGGGHTWPGATVSSGPGPQNETLDAAKVIAAFFAAHPLAQT